MRTHIAFTEITNESRTIPLVDRRVIPIQECELLTRDYKDTKRESEYWISGYRVTKEEYSRVRDILLPGGV